MIRHILLDTGPLVALLSQRDPFHHWTVMQAAQWERPILTCEAVLTEAFHLLRNVPRGHEAILAMLQNDVLRVGFSLPDHLENVASLLKRYSDIPMSLADACLVCMSELAGESTGPVCTIDSDFRIYRRNRRQRIPVLMPPGRL